MLMSVGSAVSRVVPDALAAAGCVWPEVTRRDVDGLRTLVVDCLEVRSSRGEPIRSSAASVAIAEKVWKAPEPRVASVLVNVSQGTDSGRLRRQVSRAFSLTELRALFGPRDVTLDRIGQLHMAARRVGDLATVLLFGGLLVGSLIAPAWLGARSARSGVVLMWVRR